MSGRSLTLGAKASFSPDHLQRVRMSARYWSRLPKLNRSGFAVEKLEAVYSSRAVLYVYATLRRRLYWVAERGDYDRWPQWKTQPPAAHFNLLLTSAAVSAS